MLYPTALEQADSAHERRGVCDRQAGGLGPRPVSPKLAADVACEREAGEFHGRQAGAAFVRPGNTRFGTNGPKVVYRQERQCPGPDLKVRPTHVCPS